MQLIDKLAEKVRKNPEIYELFITRSEWDQLYDEMKSTKYHLRDEIDIKGPMYSRFYIRGVPVSLLDG